MKQQIDHNNYEIYICTYNYYGKPYSFEIPAESFEDAEKRLKNIGSNGRVDGILKMTIPVPSKKSILDKIKSFFS